jgi:hypothetical protein
MGLLFIFSLTLWCNHYPTINALLSSSITTITTTTSNTTATLLYDLCGEGEWRNITAQDNDSLYFLHASRMRQHHDDSKAGIEQDLQEYFQQACPSESLIHACYFHKDRDPLKTQSLEHRLYFPTNPTCQSFDPYLFLEMLRHRRLILIGDSVMGQLFSSLLCSLYRITHAVYGLDFQMLWKGNCTPLTCPFNQAIHSHLEGGWINFPVVNASIIHLSAFTYDFNALKSMLNSLAMPLTRHDVVIHNFGLHYNEEHEFQIAMNAFVSDISGLLNTVTSSSSSDESSSIDTNLSESEDQGSHLNKDQQQHGGPHWFFIDTLPQHFSTPLNGYYSNNMPKPMCQATTNFTEKFENDWRNRIAEKALSNVHSKLHYVPMAPALYDQVDAHIGLNLLKFSTTDCTHWCYPSNIFRYLHMMVYNLIRKRVNHIFPSNALTNPKHAHGLYQGEVPYMLPPKMKDGMLIKGPDTASIYLIEKGMLREFQSWNAFVSRGYDLSQVRQFFTYEFAGIPHGEGLY